MIKAFNTSILYFDGGCGPINPGGIMYGAAILYDSSNGKVDKKVKRSVQCMLGERKDNNSNIAEYHALLSGLRLAKQNNVKRLAIRGDSEYVISQLTNKTPGKGYVKLLYEDAIQQLSIFDEWKAQHVKRAHNREAHVLANELYLAYKNNANVL